MATLKERAEALAIQTIANRIADEELGTQSKGNGAFINWVNNSMIRERTYTKDGVEKTLVSVSCDVTDDLIKNKEPGTLISLTLTPSFIRRFKSTFASGQISDQYTNIMLAKNPNAAVNVSYAVAGSGVEVTDESGKTKIQYTYDKTTVKAGALAASYAAAKKAWFEANK